MAAGTALHPLGRVYQQWALDFVIEAVRAVAQDYGENPDTYRKLPDTVGTALDNFRTKVGIDADWPSFADRNAIYDAQLGEWFSEAAAAFRLAVVAYVERSNEATRAIATQATLDAVDSFRVQLQARGGPVLQRRYGAATSMFQAAVQLLRSGQLAQIFNETAAPGDPWPFGGGPDAEGANLVGAIAKELFPAIIGRMSSYKFLLLQRVANHGALTLSSVLDGGGGDPRSSLEALMEPAYAWCVAARELVPVSTVVSAWRREAVRQSLTNLERSLLPPHPAGDVTMSGTELHTAVARLRSIGGGFGGLGGGGVFEGGFSTSTVADNVCCSTGDLSCVTDASCVSVVEHCPTEGFCPTSPGSGLSCNGPCSSGKHHC